MLYLNSFGFAFSFCLCFLFTIYLTPGIGIASSWDSKTGGFCEKTLLPDFCSRFTLLLELEWQVLGIPKPELFARKIYYQFVLLDQVVTNIYPIVPFPLPLHAPCPSLSHLNTFRAGSHGTPCQTERSRDSLPRRACPEC